MKKQTKVLLAAALMTIGASFTSMAALSNGTWVLNEEGWQYADKEGEYVSNEWCKSNGINFWINDDEVLGSSEWVSDDDGYTYYVQSDGSMTKGAWKYLYEMDDEDEEGDQYWFWFDAKGRMVKDTKKTIGDYTYYFDEDGKMLTGWVDKTNFEEAATTDALADLVYTNEDGQLVKSSWLHVFPWTEDDGYEGEDEEYFWAKSDGTIASSKTNIDGLTYFFNKDTGIMIEGWVEKVVEGDTTYYTASNALTKGKTAYWTNEIGYASKNTWEELERPEEDDETFWYHFNKLGEVFIASDTDATLYEATFADGEDYEMTASTTAVATEILKINGVEYYFNQKGEMIDGLQYIGSDLVYFVDGAKTTGKVTLTDEYENDFTFVFAPKTEDGNTKYVAVTGNYDGYCYVNGQLQTSDEEDVIVLVDIDGNGVDEGDFFVDHNGKIQKKTTKDYLDNGYTYTFSTAKDNTKNSIATINKVEE